MDHIVEREEKDPSSLAKTRPVDAYVRGILEHESLLRACIYRYARNSADVDELLQETYVRLLKGRETVEGQARSMRAFCLTVARNVSLDWLRHRQVVSIELMADLEEIELPDEDMGGEQVDEIINTHQELERIAVAVGQLPEKCREVFTLRRVYGLSQKEIARKLNISENTVEQHLTKAVRRCAEFISLSEPATLDVDCRSGWMGRWLHKRQRNGTG